MNWGGALLIGVTTCFVSWIATRYVLQILRKLAILDQPNERSSHTTPIPRGGGVVIIALVIIGWLLVWIFEKNYAPADRLWLLLIAGTILALVSFLDDIFNNLHAFVRLFLQVIAVTAGIISLPQGHGIFHAVLPAEFDLALSGIIWLWFINLFNFMDGIDGIASSQTITAALGIFGTFLLMPGIIYVDTYALIVAAAAIGFLPWNWQPARVFLGDTGSIPLGYFIGWLLILLSSNGMWQPAIILVMYFIADSSFTLLRRLSRGERIWHAHKQHYYQYAVQMGRSHRHVVFVITAVNALLVCLAFIAVQSSIHGWYSFSVGVLLTVCLLYYLRFSKPRLNNEK